MEYQAGTVVVIILGNFQTNSAYISRDKGSCYAELLLSPIILLQNLFLA